MKIETETPILEIHAGKSVSIRSFAEQNGLSSDLVAKEIRDQLREHYYNYGTRPLLLQYSPTEGHVVEATSTIGLLRAPHFLIRLVPKIRGLSLGKCLAMSQMAGTNITNFDNRGPLHVLISEHAAYSTIEALSFSFLDALLTIRNNGFARRFDEVLVPATKAGSNIEFQLSVNRAQMMPPIVSDLEPSNDTLPNQLLRTAYDRAVAVVRNQRLKKALLQLSEDFAGVSVLDPSARVDSLLLQDFTFRRSDYERALKIALSILNGNLFDSGGDSELMPAFTMDLDKLFERFATRVMEGMLSSKKFDVLEQTPFKHDTDPLLDGDFVPDLIVVNRSKGTRLLLDMKNKYSALQEAGQFSVSNPDLYQITYYALNLGVKDSILVFPSCTPSPQFPIKTSESAEAYEAKINRFVAADQAYHRTLIVGTPCHFSLYVYYIDLSGPMENTLRSIASLCLFAEYLVGR